jgi:hypothetical protein
MKDLIRTELKKIGFDGEYNSTILNYEGKGINLESYMIWLNVNDDQVEITDTFQDIGKQ